MKDKMKKKEIKKIEDKLSDMQVPDSVLNLARAEMSQTDKVHKPAPRKFNFKIALSCAASFVLCLAIILPITLSSFDKNGGDAPPDFSTGDTSTGAPPTVESSYYYLSELYKDYPVYDGEHSSGSSEPQPPLDGELKIKYLSEANYYNGDVAIISEKTYSVYGNVCTVYVLYNQKYRVDVLEPFNNFTSEYSVSSVKVNYKTDGVSYLAEADYKNKNYYFTGKFAQITHFEEFCIYLFK